MALDSDRMASAIAQALDDADLLLDKAATEDIWVIICAKIVGELVNNGVVEVGIGVSVDTGTGEGATNEEGSIE